MNIQPEIITFAATLSRVEMAILAGADHLILEDSKVSLRSFENHFSNTDFSHLISLANHARSLNPNIKLTANCDLLVHEKHYPILEKFYLALKDASISSVRIQDPGLLVYFKSCWPEVTFHFAQETGNHNVKSIAYYSKYCKRQVLNNELTVSEIKHTISLVPCEFEIQVQGPILIQYSNRRFLHGYEHTDESEAPEIHTHTAFDKEYPGREFIFHDNPHGHFMYAYFDRCLLRSIQELRDCHLAAWLIDARGESDLYLTESLKLYKSAITQDISEDAYSSFLTVTQRAQKPGFFKANFTDRGRKSPFAHVPEHMTYIGTIVDVVRDKWVTIKCDSELHLGDALYISSPRAKVVEYTIDQIKDVSFNDIQSSANHVLVLIKWRKGILAKSRVYRRI